MPLEFREDNLAEGKIKEIAKGVRNGKILVYPTETAYGIGTNSMNEKGIEEIYKIKGRPDEKKLTVIVSSLNMALKYCYLNEKERKLCEEFMPGPLTILAQKKPNVPDKLNDKFAFRITSHKTAREIVEDMGLPLIATSANVSGRGSIYSLKRLDQRVKNKADYIIDAGELEKTPPSTIIDLSSEDLRIIRQGPIKEKQIRKSLS